MIDVTLKNFEAELIHGSVQQPVLLDLWAPWCGPCKTLGPLLEKLEVAYAGRFKLAKLNSDEQPEIAGQLSQMFGVRSIPFCVLFDKGQPVDGFVGALPEAQVRAFLDKHVPSAEEAASDEEAQEAQALMADGDAEGALALLLDAVATAPGNDEARFDALRALLAAGRVDEARQLFAPVADRARDPNLPHARFAAVDHWLTAFDGASRARPAQTLAAAITANKRDFDARFELVQTHLAAHRFTEAMDELLEIVMRDKNWSEQLARRTYVAILELMGQPAVKPKTEAPAKGALELTGKAAQTAEDTLVDQYRRKLSMALF